MYSDVVDYFDYSCCLDCRARRMLHYFDFCSSTTSELRVLLYEYVLLPTATAAADSTGSYSVVVGRAYWYIPGMYYLVRCVSAPPSQIDMSLHDSLVRRTLATSPRLV